MNGDPSSPDLYCHEDPSFLYEDDEEMAEVNVVVNQNEIELEEAHLHSLIDKEIAFGFGTDEDLVIDDWVQEARLQAITWVQTRTGALGFHPRTAYLAITYFDRFISLEAIPEKKRAAFVRLISVACLLLAAKMEEMNRPPLSQYTLEFQGRSIKKMELLVLVVLKWKMNFVTPFAFLDNFIAKLCQESPPGLKSGIEKRLLSVMTEIHLMHHRPSAIAAAATLMAVDQNLAQEALEAKITSIPELYFLETEAVYSYYTIMQVP
ncbi:cyclin-D5-1 [Prunus yedoensis var. nudiflora]|uniref:B-like cyclin n=1 Tax=Prunus yedoensis var. nudiflora TaxID=2094558 RepID=A0A314XMS8_PRUYE|nr:cyclin-D5-1 [Prunus yedoensis var. nudiflora]